MEINAFYVTKKGKTKEINVNVEKALATMGIYAVIGTKLVIVSEAGTIAQSFKPLLTTLQDLAEPISYGFMIKGFMQVMAGNEHKGYKTIKNAAGGFVGVHTIPWIFGIIKGIKLG